MTQQIKGAMKRLVGSMDAVQVSALQDALGRSAAEIGGVFLELWKELTLVIGEAIQEGKNFVHKELPEVG